MCVGLGPGTVTVGRVVGPGTVGIGSGVGVVVEVPVGSLVAVAVEVGAAVLTLSSPMPARLGNSSFSSPVRAPFM